MWCFAAIVNRPYTVEKNVNKQYEQNTGNKITLPLCKRWLKSWLPQKIVSQQQNQQQWHHTVVIMRYVLDYCTSIAQDVQLLNWTYQLKMQLP